MSIRASPSLALFACAAITLGAQAADDIAAQRARIASERAAVDAKARERGGYTLRDLGSDSGVNYSLASRVMSGDRQVVQADVIVSWGRALAPYLNVDLALLAAGYAPQNRRLLDLLRRVTAAGAERWGDLEEAVGRWASEPTEGKAEEQGDEEREQHATTAQA